MPVHHLKTVSLADGRRAAIFHAPCPMPPAEGAKLGWFMEMIFGGYDKPDVFVVATAKGMYESDARNDFVWAEIDGEIVSTVWTITPDDDPRVGSLGEVFTAPQARGQGLARQVCTAILDIFDRRGGRCMFLATDNPTAARIYHELGFRPYPDGLGLMRRVTPLVPGAAPAFEAAWFMPGNVMFRSMQWGDMPRLVALYGAPNPWVSACYPQGLFSSAFVRHRRCNSLMKHTWQNTQRGLWMGMFTLPEVGQGALVGSCPVYPRGNEREIIGGELDLFVHPASIRHAVDLLEATRNALVKRGWRWLTAQLAAQDVEKAAILQRFGFAQTAVLPEALSIDGVTQDVHLYHMRL